MLSKKAKVLIGKSDVKNRSLWLPLWVHLADTAYMTEYLTRNWLPKQTQKNIGLETDILIKTAKFIGYVHDIGKATKIFQNRISKCVPEAGVRLEMFDVSGAASKKSSVYKITHAGASEAILLKFSCPPGISSVAGAHHGRPQDDNIDNLLETRDFCFWGHCRENWCEVWREFINWALKESGFNDVSELPRLSTQAQLLLTGLLIMADWIASNTRYFPLLSIDEFGKENDYPNRGRTAKNILNLTYPWESDCTSLSEASFESEFGFLPNAVQKAAIEAAQTVTVPGLFILEAQMGVGKTEAALAAAQIIARRTGSGGLYFGLPTQVTANGIFPRLESWARSQSEETAHSIRLAHARATLNDDYRKLWEGISASDDEADTGVVVHSWFSGNKQALLADFVIATVDQLLMLALKQKHVMLRHLGLAGKVVIVDECHAYDTYMNGYLDKALSWLGAYHVPVLLLTATLPQKRRAELVAAYRNERRISLSASRVESRDYPILTWTDGAEIHQRKIVYTAKKTEVRITLATENEIAARLKDKLDMGGCAGVIVNTVKKAQLVAEQLRAALPECEIFLYHAQFIAADRMDKEKNLLARIGKKSTDAQRAKFIVVGTQVLEQSLDIDFDYLISEICPMDLLLQRIGRLQRHPRHRAPLLRLPECTVIDTGNEAFDKGSCAVYAEWLLWRTRKLLPKKVELPKDIPTLVRKVYEWEKEDVLPADELSEKKKVNYEFAEKKRKNRSRNYQINSPEPEAPDDYPQPTLDGWLDNDMSDGENTARAAVRDGDTGIEVLVMVKRKDGKVYFLPWQENGSSVAADMTPEHEDAIRIARQRLRLPKALSAEWNIDRTIRELEEQNRKYLSEWQLSPMLNGELVLLLDDELSASLSGYGLRYDRQNGLEYWGENENAG